MTMFEKVAVGITIFYLKKITVFWDFFLGLNDFHASFTPPEKTSSVAELNLHLFKAKL
jgi:hypothetical protein